MITYLSDGPPPKTGVLQRNLWVFNLIWIGLFPNLKRLEGVGWGAKSTSKSFVLEILFIGDYS